MALTPHLKAPFSINAKGEARTVEQDSPGDFESRAYNVLVCPVGSRPDHPEFGVPPMLFQTIPLDLNAIQESVARWAEMDVTVTEQAQALESTIRQLTVQVGP